MPGLPESARTFAAFAGPYVTSAGLFYLIGQRPGDFTDAAVVLTTSTVKLTSAAVRTLGAEGFSAVYDSVNDPRVRHIFTDASAQVTAAAMRAPEFISWAASHGFTGIGALWHFYVSLPRRAYIYFVGDQDQARIEEENPALQTAPPHAIEHAEAAQWTEEGSETKIGRDGEMTFRCTGITSQGSPCKKWGRNGVGHPPVWQCCKRHQAQWAERRMLTYEESH